MDGKKRGGQRGSWRGITPHSMIRFSAAVRSRDKSSRHTRTLPSPSPRVTNTACSDASVGGRAKTGALVTGLVRVPSAPHAERVEAFRAAGVPRARLDARGGAGPVRIRVT